MEKIVDVLVNWQALLVAFASFALLGVIRALGTTKDKDGKIVGGFSQSKYFQMFTPTYPYLISMAFVFAPGLPLPVELSKTLAVKLMFGLWTGWLSGFSYQLAKKVLEKGFGVIFSDTLPPPAQQPVQPPAPTPPPAPVVQPTPTPEPPKDTTPGA